MSIEDPNKNLRQETAVLGERLQRVKEIQAVLERSIEIQGLSSEFIHNVAGNLLGSVAMALEVLDEPSMRAIAEENLDLAEKYLYTVSKNKEALRSEASMTFEIWSKMGQQEGNHARGIIEKYKI